jgi:hypothetical protein
VRWLELTRNQKDHLIQWVIIIAIVELIVIAFPTFAWGIFFVGGIAFLAGFVLRAAHAYPGKDEPLLLDLFSGMLALAGGVGCLLLNTPPLVVILRIATPPVAVLPHFIYIICNRELGPCGYRSR